MGEPLRVSAGSYRGKVYVDVRYWYFPKDKDRPRPCRRGISLPPFAIPWVIESLQKLLAHMERDGYLESAFEMNARPERLQFDRIRYRGWPPTCHSSRNVYPLARDFLPVIT